MSHYGIRVTNDSDPVLSGELAVQLARWHLRPLPGSRSLFVRLVRTAHPAVVVSLCASQAVKRAARKVSLAADLPVNWSLSLWGRDTLEIGVVPGDAAAHRAAQAGWGLLVWAASERPGFARWQWMVLNGPEVQNPPSPKTAIDSHPRAAAASSDLAELSSRQEEVDDVASEKPPEQLAPVSQKVAPRAVFTQQTQPIRKMHALKEPHAVVQPPKPAAKNPRRG